MVKLDPRAWWPFLTQTLERCWRLLRPSGCAPMRPTPVGPSSATAGPIEMTRFRQPPNNGLLSPNPGETTMTASVLQDVESAFTVAEKAVASFVATVETDGAK